jgi:hypothetical protein
MQAKPFSIESTTEITTGRYHLRVTLWFGIVPRRDNRPLTPLCTSCWAACRCNSANAGDMDSFLFRAGNKCNLLPPQRILLPEARFNTFGCTPNFAYAGCSCMLNESHVVVSYVTASNSSMRLVAESCETDLQKNRKTLAHIPPCRLLWTANMLANMYDLSAGSTYSTSTQTRVA